jgi:xanthine dehydrogenase YagR molybdenum-binding subunit
VITGQGIDRVDGSLKVCGRAPFAAEYAPPGLLHAVLVTSDVASGRIVRMDVAAATALPGVIAVLTPMNAPRLPQKGQWGVAPPAGRVLSLLQDDVVSYNNQPIAVAIADTLERATQAARLVRVVYAPGEAKLDFATAKARAFAPERANREPTDHQRGDLVAGMAGAATKVGAIYTTPIEHHNPMEPHATVAEWSGDRLTLHDATQNVGGVRTTLARIFAVAPENVTVIDPFVGGGFGCKGSAWSHVALAALASRAVGRPVRLVLERPQMFGSVGNRPHTEQTLALGCDRDGRLTAVAHQTISETSMLEDWSENSSLPARHLYACANNLSTHRIAKLNIATPTFTRAPGEASGNFALECAMDELAFALKIDPLELRLRNYAEQDPSKNRPYSSKSLRECYRLGAERFGWQRRAALPGTMRDGRWRVGLGMATATYPANRSAAEALVRLLPDGNVVVRSATHDLGTGTYTVMSQVAADAIGVPVAKVRFELGDSRLPKAPGAGGSQSAASVAPAVHAAGLAMRAKLIELAIADPRSFAYHADAAQITVIDGWLRSASAAALPANRPLADAASSGEPIAALLARNGNAALETRAEAKPGAEREQYSMHSFGAVFAEVRVDAELGIVRVPRVTAVYGVGTVLNAKTARSQMLGGVVWGVGMALFEESVRDGRDGRIVNANLAEYHVPVNADIGAIDIAFVPESDAWVNPLGVKGIGEIGITGVPAAIANAVFNATGKRVRDLPITLDKLL